LCRLNSCTFAATLFSFNVLREYAIIPGYDKILSGMLKVYKGLMAYANPSWRLILTFFGFTIIAVFFSIFQFALIIPLLNFLFNNHITVAEAAKYSHPPDFKLTVHIVQDFFYYHVYKWKMENPRYALYFLATTIVSSVVLGNVFRYLAQRALINSRTMLVKKLREALFAKINHLHLGYFTKEHKGDLLSRMNSDVFEIEAVASNSIEVLFKEPYLFIGYFIALFFISVKLTLLLLSQRN
jgi:ATP-binding cassette, subfamily B, bacterial MsbA